MTTILRTAFLALTSLACASAERSSRGAGLPQADQSTAVPERGATRPPDGGEGDSRDDPVDSDPALGVLRGLLAEARQAEVAEDSASARTRIASAIEEGLAQLATREDPATLGLLEEMGRFAHRVGEMRGAERAFGRVLEVRSRNLADDHVELQKARGNLAVALKSRGDWAGARALEERVLEAFSRTLPDEHPDLQTIRANLASTLAGLGDFEAARALEERVLEIGTRTLPDDHEDLQSARLSLAITIKALGDLAGARVLEEKVLEIFERTLPPDHGDLQMVRGNLAVTRHRLGDLTGARAMQQMVLEVYSRTLPDDHADLQMARSNLAATILELGDLAGARALQEKVLNVRARTLPEDHPDLQTARLNLATALYALGDLAAARTLFEGVLEVGSRTLPDDHPDLQRARENLAAALHALGDLAEARALQETALEIRSRTLPDDHPDLQTARGNLALTMYSLGDLANALALFEKVLESASRTLPDDHPDLQRARENLAAARHALGDLAEARALEEKVLEVRSRTLPNDHPDLQAARMNLGSTLKTMGDLAGARRLFESVLEVISRSLPDDHPDLQRARGNLALAIKDLGDLASARALEEMVVEVGSRTLPDDHPDLQRARLNLAGTLVLLGDPAGAREHLTRVLEVDSRTLPEDHPDLQRARLGLALTVKALGDFAGARELEEKALEVGSRTLPSDHPDLQMARGNLAATIAAESAALPLGASEDRTRKLAVGRARCAELILALCHAQSDAVRAVLLSSPSREAEERCAGLAQELDLALSFARGCGVFEPSPELEAPAFVLSETARGAAIASATLTRRASAAPRYAELREAFVDACDDLAALARKGTTSEEFDAARTAREKAEANLIALDSTGGELPAIALEVSSLSQRLGELAASVSFRQFKDTRIEPPRDSDPGSGAVPLEVSAQRLCAFVVRGRENADAASASGAAPESLTLVDLGPLDTIESAVREWRGALGVAGGRGVSPSSGALAGDPRPSGDRLRELLLDPLLPAIGERERLVLVPDDVLHLVAFDALPLDPSGATLVGDRWRIEMRATLGELWSESPSPRSERTLLAVGGVRYDGREREEALQADGEGAPGATAATATHAQVQAPGADLSPSTAGGTGSGAESVTREVRVAGLLRGGPWSEGFPELPATSEEAQGITAVFAEEFGEEASSTLLGRAEATREELLELAPGARFLHVATHGWFAPESIPAWGDPSPLDAKSALGLRLSGDEQVRGMSPMLLCGLALAGANLPEDAAGRAPGLVTAEVIAALDLSGCELAVLSACDTNVGERRAGQGVASLQRALHMAGARTVITSLWKVPDEATRDLMIDFYRRLWIEKKPKHQALWEAKTKLRNEKDENGRLKYTPRDWAAWVLTGNPD